MKTGSQIQSRVSEYAKKDISQMYKDFNISDDGYNDQQVRFTPVSSFFSAIIVGTSSKIPSISLSRR